MNSRDVLTRLKNVCGIKGVEDNIDGQLKYAVWTPSTPPWSFSTEGCRHSFFIFDFA